jgi:hypothetical protein
MPTRWHVATSVESKWPPLCLRTTLGALPHSHEGMHTLTKHSFFRNQEPEWVRFRVAVFSIIVSCHMILDR